MRYLSQAGAHTDETGGRELNAQSLASFSKSQKDYLVARIPDLAFKLTTTDLSRSEQKQID